MKHVVLKTERMEMKFPLDFLTPQITVDAIDNEDTIEFMDTVPSMKYTKENAEMFMDFLRYTAESAEKLELFSLFLTMMKCTSISMVSSDMVMRPI